MITVLTPTYNRANTLERLYNSLLIQTSKDFEWLVIDDGSQDDTEKLISSFIAQNKIRLNYYRKSNGGKHTALNYSHPYINGDLLLIVDSDDFITEDAIETIAIDWEKYENNKSIAGITYLRGSDVNHSLNDYYFDKDEFISDCIEQHVNHKKVPDKCEVIRSDVFKSLTFPEYKGEKFLGESYLWNYVGLNYKMVFINKVLYICSYLDGGLTKSGRKLRIHCPLGGMINSKTYFNKRVRFVQRVKNAILFDCYGFFANLNPIKILIAGKDFFATICLPIGWILYLKWKTQYRK